MTRDREGPAVGGISSEAVRKATGRGWEEWLEALDAAGAADWDHKQIVAYLEREHAGATSPWWRQTLTVGYERARGRREVGQTADAGFQVGVQKTVPTSPRAVWEVLTSQPELWLGEGLSGDLAEGVQYRVAGGSGSPGASGEVRVVRPGERLRMTWQPEGWAAPATLQLTLVASGPDRTAVRVHLEKLPDAGARETMRSRWRQALARVAAAVAA